MLPHRDSESLLVGEVDDAVQRREVVVVRPAPQHITTVDEDGTGQDRGGGATSQTADRARCPAYRSAQ